MATKYPREIKDGWHPRTKARIKLANIIAAHRGGAYQFVHTGAVNWVTFDFDKYKLAAAITLDEAALFRSEIGSGLTIGIELMGRLPAKADELNPDFADTLYNDAEAFLEELASAVDDRGNSYVLKYNRRLAQGVEVMDAEKQVQGLLVTCSVEV